MLNLGRHEDLSPWKKVNITFKGRLILMSTENKSIHDRIFSTFTFVVEVMFNLRTFSYALATVIKLS